MPEEDLLEAIASARNARLRHHAVLWKLIVGLAVSALACALGAMGMLDASAPPAVAAEQDEPLSIEEGIREAVAHEGNLPAVDWERWLGINSDIVGWMSVRDTSIDHPIVMAKAQNPTFYLTHGLDGSADAKGCIFLDAECEAALDSMHAVVYGHNWDGNEVFADLARYADATFAASHSEILVQTPSWEERLSVQCVEVANGTDGTNVIGFENAGAMLEWYRARYRASVVKLGDEPADGREIERIFTFCTCADGGGDKRVLVYAIPARNARAASRDSESTA